MRISRRVAGLLALTIPLFVLPGIGRSAPRPRTRGLAAEKNSAATIYIAAGSVLRVSIAERVKLSRLVPGEIISGVTAEPVYSSDQLALPSGSRVRLVVERSERIKSARPSIWRLMGMLFRPPAQWKRSYRVLLRSAAVGIPGQGITPAALEFIRAERPEQIHPSLAAGNRVQSNTQPRTRPPEPRTTFLLTFIKPLAIPASLAKGPSVAKAVKKPVTLHAGARARFLLLNPISASSSRRGQTFLARLTAPVFAANGGLLPAGSILKGRVSDRKSPRRFWRSGSLHLSVSAISSACGFTAPAAGQLSGVEAGEDSRLRMTSEGTLVARPPSKATLLFNLGVTGGISKVADDSFQLVLESIISGATDASTAGSARWVAAAASALFLATRRGQDVRLPKYTEIDVTFTRPVVMKTTSQPGPACR